MRRPLIAAGLAAAVLCLLPGPAVAAQTVTVRSPAPDSVVSAPTAVTIDVERDLVDEPTTALEVRLARAGTEPGTWKVAPGAAPLECAPEQGEGCDDGPNDRISTWAGAVLRPAGGGPFSPDAPLCNGRWHVQVRLNGGESFRVPGTPVLLSAPPTAVTELAASVEGARISLSWTPGRDPDLVGHQVQRRAESGEWTELAQLSADADAFETIGTPGRHRFRVVTQRGDGRDAAGEPLPACGDPGRDLTTASPAVEVTVAAPTDDPSPSASPDGTTSPDGGGDGEGSAADDGDGGEDASGNAAGSSGSSPRSRAARSSTPDLVPDLARPSFEGGQTTRPRERYYGDDMEFREELDYAGASPVPGEGGAEFVERVLDGGTVHVVAGMELELGRILPPVAGGLVMFTMGLHLRRWMRVD